MKKITIVIILITTANLQAQYLKLSELIKIQGSTLVQINDILLEKSWVLLKSHHDETLTEKYVKGQDWTVTSGLWIVKKNDKTECQLEYSNHLVFINGGLLKHENMKSVGYRLKSREQFLNVKKELEKFDFVLLNERLGEGVIQQSFVNSTHIIRFSTETPRNDNPQFIIHILNKPKWSKPD